LVQPILVIHILTGVICLIVGLLAAVVKKKKGVHTFLGEVYHFSYMIVFISAITLALMNWSESAYLFFIGLFSYALAFSGYIASKRRKKNWLAVHIGGILGSYIAIITATLVVNASKIPLLNEMPILLVWFLPTIIGTPFIVAIGRMYSRPKTLEH
jgi:hypothetical protein